MAERRRVRRVGLTMRVVEAAGYHELRDALAHDWGRFLERVDPALVWVPIPNLGRRAVAVARDLGLEGLVLTGGNDVGSAPVRDATEGALLDDALGRGLPVIAVCRGMQFLQTRLGGELRACDAGAHVAARHPVAVRGGTCIRVEALDVNSFHRLGIRADGLAPGLAPFAVTDDGWVEGATLRGGDATAVMWHPEREDPPLTHDIILFRDRLGIPAEELR